MTLQLLLCSSKEKRERAIEDWKIGRMKNEPEKKEGKDKQMEREDVLKKQTKEGRVK